ncbi:MAG TPA: hypothetical protein VIJ22_19315 [Polyangiaceae bacterium]
MSTQPGPARVLVATATTVLMVLVVALASASVACVDETDPEARSARSHLNDSRVTGTSSGADSTRGGIDMPGKGRGGDHDRHSMTHK